MDWMKAIRFGVIVAIVSLSARPALAVDPDELKTLWASNPSADRVFEVLTGDVTLAHSLADRLSMTEALLPGLRHPDPDVRGRVISDLSRFAENIGMGKEKFIEILSPYRKDPRTRAMATSLTLRVSSFVERVEILTAEFSSPEATTQTRRDAARRLGELQSEIHRFGHFSGKRKALDHIDQALLALKPSSDPVLRAHGLMNVLGAESLKVADRRELSALLSASELSEGTRRAAWNVLQGHGTWSDAQVSLNLLRAAMRPENQSRKADLLRKAKMGGGPDILAAKPEELDPLRLEIARVWSEAMDPKVRNSAESILTRLNEPGDGSLQYADVFVTDNLDLENLAKRLETDLRPGSEYAYRNGLITLMRHPNHRVRTLATNVLEKHLRADSASPESLTYEQRQRLPHEYDGQIFPFLAFRYAESPERKLQITHLAARSPVPEQQAALVRALNWEPIPDGEKMPKEWDLYQKILEDYARTEDPMDALEILLRLEEKYPAGKSDALRTALVERLKYSQDFDRANLALKALPPGRLPLKPLIAAYEVQKNSSHRAQIADLMEMARLFPGPEEHSAAETEHFRKLESDPRDPELQKTARKALENGSIRREVAPKPVAPTQTKCSRAQALLKPLDPRKPSIRKVMLATALGVPVGVVAINRLRERMANYGQTAALQKPIGADTAAGVPYPSPTDEEWKKAGTLLRQVYLPKEHKDQVTGWKIPGSAFDREEGPTAFLAHYRKAMGREFDGKAEELGFDPRLFDLAKNPSSRNLGLENNYKDSFLQFNRQTDKLDDLFAHVVKWQYERMTENGRRLGSRRGELATATEVERKLGSVSALLEHMVASEGRDATAVRPPLPASTQPWAELDRGRKWMELERALESRNLSFHGTLLDYDRWIPGGVRPLFRAEGLELPEDFSPFSEWLRGLKAWELHAFRRGLIRIALWQSDRLEQNARQRIGTGRFRDAFEDVDIKDAESLLDYVQKKWIRNDQPMPKQLGMFRGDPSGLEAEITRVLNAIGSMVLPIWELGPDARLEVARQMKEKGYAVDFATPLTTYESKLRLDTEGRAFLQKVATPFWPKQLAGEFRDWDPALDIRRALEIVSTRPPEGAGFSELRRFLKVAPTYLEPRPFTLLSDRVRIPADALSKSVRAFAGLAELEKELAEKGVRVTIDDAKYEAAYRARTAEMKAPSAGPPALTLSSAGKEQEVVIKEETLLIDFLAELRQTESRQTEEGAELEGYVAQRDAAVAKLRLAEANGIVLPDEERARLYRAVIQAEEQVRSAFGPAIFGSPSGNDGRGPQREAGR